MTDTIRAFLIISLVLSILASSGFYIFEMMLYGYMSQRFLMADILCIAQIVLIVVLCATKRVKTLTTALVLMTVIILVIFAMEIRFLWRFTEDSREKFYRLIKKYPVGTTPKEWSLMTSYLAIKHEKCCGVDDAPAIESQDVHLYFLFFPGNCPSDNGHFSKLPRLQYHGEPCMELMYHMHSKIQTLSAIKMIFLTLNLLLFATYILQNQRQRIRRVPPPVGITTVPMTTYPWQTRVNDPDNVAPPPLYS